jgi:hypothetical protein
MRVPDIRSQYPAEAFLKGEKKEIWMQLCERAASEQDPDKLMELVREINRLLEEKERRLKNTSGNPKRAS